MSSSGGHATHGGAGGTRDNEECPKKFKTTLVDVLQTGNGSVALSLQPGTLLSLRPSEDRQAVIVSHQAADIGFLPPQYSVLVSCLQVGWKYSASVVNVEGGAKAPRVTIQVIGTPP